MSASAVMLSSALRRNCCLTSPPLTLSFFHLDANWNAHNRKISWFRFWSILQQQQCKITQRSISFCFYPKCRDLIFHLNFQGAKILQASHFDYEYVLGHKIAFLCVAKGTCLLSESHNIRKIISKIYRKATSWDHLAEGRCRNIPTFVHARKTIAVFQ